MKIAFILMSLVAAFAFSIRVGDGWYEHNDGVTIACSLEPVWKLLHPGNMSVKGCSFDHQPLYILFVKFTSGLSQYKLIFYQAFNALFYFIGWLMLALALVQSVHWSLALSLPFFFLSSFNTLHWIQELRMYALFLATSSILLSDLLHAQRSESVRKISLINHVIGYFNFFMYCLPFAVNLSYYYAHWKKIDKKLRVLSVTLLILLLVKIPFVFWWRFQSRRGGLSLGFDHIWKVFFEELFKGTALYATIAWMILIPALGWQILQVKRRLASRWYLGLIFISYALVTVCTLLEMHEIELRYLLFFYPLFAIVTAEAMDRMPLKIKLSLSLILIMVGFQNATQMRIRGVPDGGEIRLSSEAYTKYSDDRETWTDDPYFFFNYVGVYSYVHSGRKPEIHDSASEQAELIKNPVLFVTVLRSEDEHEELLKKFPGDKKRVWAVGNLLGSKTIMTEIMASKP